MESLPSSVTDFLSGPQALNVLYALVKLIAGLLLARLGSGAISRIFSERASPHQAVLLRRVIFYAILGLFVASALNDLGVDLSVLLGAAGILTVAIGFASQTSASNIISGLFLLGEKPFSVGDVIRIGTTSGEVLSIDLMSVKIRTFDNLFVRVPNETIIKTEITNNTRFPIRRLDIMLGVAYKEDLRHVRSVVERVADRNPLVLTEPAPLFIFTGYGDSALTFQFSVWAARANYLAIKTGLQIEIKEAFDAEGIEIPFPQRSLHAGSGTDPFPVRVVSGLEHEAPATT